MNLSKNIKNIFTRLKFPFVFHKTVQLGGERKLVNVDINHEGIHRTIILSPYQEDANQIQEEELRYFMECSQTLQNCALYQREFFVSEMRNAKVNLKNGLVATSDNRLLVDSANTLRELKKTGIFGSAVPLAPKKLQGTFTTIAGILLPSGNYYHWLLEYLPRLYSLKQSGLKEIELLMSDNLNEFQKDTLIDCLPEGIKIRYETKEWVQCEKFYFLSLAGERPVFPREYLLYIRNAILNKIPLSKSTSKNRIYISRKNARHRKVLNEDAVLELLGKYEFKNYELEKIPFYEQVSLFRNADIVIGTHGAGLTNLLFSEKTKVIEFVHAHPNGAYFVLAQKLGHDYKYIMNQNEKKNPDFFVEIKVLEEKLKSITLSSGSYL